MAARVYNVVFTYLPIHRAFQVALDHAVEEASTFTRPRERIFSAHGEKHRRCIHLKLEAEFLHRGFHSPGDDFGVNLSQEGTAIIIFVVSIFLAVAFPMVNSTSTVASR